MKKPKTRPEIVAEEAFEYLGRYAHRLVISNNRILLVEGGMGTFLWKDYRDESRMKEMALPFDFTRTHHYSLFSSRNKTLSLSCTTWQWL
jgi:hypothetical protein